jgi:DNA-binding NtrC family response regulator
VGDPAIKPKLLVVDDEPDMLDFLERVFRRSYDVVRASCAEDALDILAADDFEVIITDQKMPRISGVQLLESIGDRYPRMVRVLISGFAEMPEVQGAAERCRIHNYILKPVDSRKLLESVEHAYKVRDGAPLRPVGE